MATAYSSSILARIKQYDVFISFRGEDTRNVFTCHLYDAFHRKKIKAYLDEESLDKGDEISPALMKAIQESKISVVILSKNYASSSWCLEELRHILHCKEIDEQIVVPIFYHVDSSHVRKQQESYAAAFTAHEQRFHDKTDKVQQWRNALTIVSNLSGWDSSVIGSDSKLVEAIVNDIVGKLNRLSSCVNLKGLVGIDRQFEKIESMLDIGSLDVRIVGIWGIGGIGKTTLAHVLFNRFACQFEGCLFLENTKAERSRLSSFKALFSGLLGEESSVIVNEFVKNRLRRTKSLVVLDDVDNAVQLRYLIGEGDLFGPGTKIIITTRDAQVLNSFFAHGIYKVESLDFEESLQLFCSKAFRGSSPPEDYALLSRKVVEYCQGLPLSLEVLGGHLCSKSTKVWESALGKLIALGKLKESLNPQIHNVLRISYDGLEPNEKEIFLDIACFFKGRDREFVERILHAYDLHVEIGIEILVDKALITLKGNSFFMHDLLLEMGHQIVREESKEPGNRSRLWLAKDICRVLRYKTGTGVVQAMSLNFCELENNIDLDPLVFKGMRNLKFLSFHSQYEGTKNLNLPQGLQSLPDELIYFCWKNYPLRSLPQNFIPEKLVELHLEGSKLEKLWDGIQNLGSLKILNLHQSKNLTEIPDLSLALNLKVLLLSDCNSLEHLPTSIGKLTSLLSLSLSCCSKLEYFPEILEPMPNLGLLCLRYSGIRKLPASIANLVGIKLLFLHNCKNLEFISDAVYNLDLSFLDLSNCWKLENLPGPLSNGIPLRSLDLRDTSVSQIPDNLFSYLTLLSDVNLSRTNIRRIPESIKFSKFHRLYIRDCKFLQSIPELPLTIREVDARGCTSLEMVSNSMAALTQPPKDDVCCPVRFEFSQCIKLKHQNIMPEFQIRALLIATKFALQGDSTQKDKEMSIALPMEITTPTNLALQGDNTQEDEFGRIEMWYPGEEIPKWFNLQTEGRSMNVRLPYNPKSFFMGFAFCFIVKQPECKEITYLDCEIHVETIYGNEWKTRCDVVSGRFHLENRKSLHVLMTTFMSKEESFSLAREISFNIIGTSKIEIRRFGVRILRVEDAIDFGIISGQSNDVTNKGKQSRFQKSMLEQLHYLKGFPIEERTL